jgi:hypothetical protein
LSGVLSANDLKEFVVKKYDFLKTQAQRDGIFEELDVNFDPGTPNNREGVYAYSDADGYHYVFTEKGSVASHQTSNDLFAVSYWIIKDQVSQMASRFAARHRKPDGDFRRTLFSKELELLNLVGPEYAKKRAEEIQGILALNPYVEVT